MQINLKNNYEMVVLMPGIKTIILQTTKLMKKTIKQIFNLFHQKIEVCQAIKNTKTYWNEFNEVTKKIKKQISDTIKYIESRYWVIIWS